ncbi:uncharacterized protein BO97DRAFT_74560 [Aspergillus homomorphus CBS 101889]|uniref:Uncharacterized protein n=1 Tax=Aspergillus homomorphus (strain CBS 101889) TaxID=1450537 RepID=A0A395I9M2_ASPHC|nr:hypothetical protein BO97DRAFT_74560 [Aspergillus homomorphus CBS 101889]RAL16731.1 hypothetical protein BO97DRAFT_74560 [Aspergillus homomorphus CBS 101889]
MKTQSQPCLTDYTVDLVSGSLALRFNPRLPAKLPRLVSLYFSALILFLYHASSLHIVLCVASQPMGIRQMVMPRFDEALPVCICRKSRTVMLPCLSGRKDAGYHLELLFLGLTINRCT